VRIFHQDRKLRGDPKNGGWKRFLLPRKIPDLTDSTSFEQILSIYEIHRESVLPQGLGTADGQPILKIMNLAFHYVKP